MDKFSCGLNFTNKGFEKISLDLILRVNNNGCEKGYWL